jgi:hypothetical protein
VIEFYTVKPVRNADTVAKLCEMADGPPLEPVVAIERAAARIADEMKMIHGGRWSIDIDHGACFVAVSRNWP